MRKRREQPSRPAAPQGSCGHATTGCEIGELFRVLGKSHMLPILWTFVRDAPAPRRFVEVQHELGLSPNTLSARLKDLVNAGLLSRVVYNEIPPRVDYAATAKALDLGGVFDSLHEWTKRHDLSPATPDEETRVVA